MILQTFEAFEKDLKVTSKRSYYLITGSEQYLCRLAVDLVRSTLLNSDDASFDSSYFSAADASIEIIFETANTYPMLLKRRLVFVTDLEKLPEREHEKLLERLEQLPLHTLLILVAAELDRRKKLYKTMQSKGCIVEFSKLKGVELERWVEAFAHRRGYRLLPRMTKKIIHMVGSDLQALVAELEKLFLFTEQKGQIPEEAIDDLVQNSRQHGIFELIDAIGSRNRASALLSLANLLGMGEYPLFIVTMMARHSRQILVAKECIQRGMNSRETGKAAQIPPFILDKFIRQAKAIDTETVKRMHRGLHEIDRRMKSSSVDACTLLEVFICNLV